MRSVHSILHFEYFSLIFNYEQYFLSVVKGAPVSIHWDHISQSTYSLEAYENVRHDERRVQSQMKMPHGVRAKMLSREGFSMTEIREASRDAAISRRQRIRTIEMLHNQQLEEKFESLRRRFSWQVRRKKKKQVANSSSSRSNKQTRQSQTQYQRATKRHLNSPSVEKQADLEGSLDSNLKAEMNSSRSAKSYNLNFVDDDLTSDAPYEDNKDERGNELNDTKRTSNFVLQSDSHTKDMKKDDLNSSRRGKRYDLTPGNGGDDLNDIESGRQSDFTQNQEERRDSGKNSVGNGHETTTSSSLHIASDNDINKSRSGKRYDLTPTASSTNDSKDDESTNSITDEDSEREISSDLKDTSNDKKVHLLKSRDNGGACGIFTRICKKALCCDRSVGSEK